MTNAVLFLLFVASTIPCVVSAPDVAAAPPSVLATFDVTSATVLTLVPVDAAN
jgi:hypothetical protein